MKIAILTAVCGSRESLSNPSIVHPDADYYAFVDKKVPGLVWNQETPIHFSNDSKYAMRRDAKIYKVLPELFVPNYDYYIWVDASHDVIMSPTELCNRFVSNVDYALFSHRERNCVYEEAELLKEIKYDHVHLIEEEMKYFKSLGYPANNGLFELPSFVKRKTHLSTLTSMKWWEYICKYASRDQISLPVCLWEANANVNVFPGHINGHNMKNGIIEQTRTHVPSGE